MQADLGSVSRSEDVMTLPEVARYLGVSKDTVYRRAAKDEIPGAFRVGNLWRVSRPAFLKAIHDWTPEASQ